MARQPNQVVGKSALLIAIPCNKIFAREGVQSHNKVQVVAVRSHENIFKVKTDPSASCGP